MTEHFDKIQSEYAAKFKEFGVSSASMLMPKGRHSTRYSVLAEYLRVEENPSLLDYGCGLGFLHDYLNSEQINHQYLGVDMTQSFINNCRERFPRSARFEHLDPKGNVDGLFDFVYASGVFNLQSDSSQQKSLNYVRERLEYLYGLTQKIMIVDFLSPDVDFRQEGAQHIDYRLVLEWLTPVFSRRWLLRHDYLPFEYSLVLFKQDEIQRPENIFRENGKE